MILAEEQTLPPFLTMHLTILLIFKLPSQYLKTIHGYQKIPEVKLRLNKQLQKIKRGFQIHMAIDQN